MAVAAAAVVDIFVVVVGDNPLAVCSYSCALSEGVAVVSAGSGTGQRRSRSLGKGWGGRSAPISASASDLALDWSCAWASAWASAWVSNYLIPSFRYWTTCSPWRCSSLYSCSFFGAAAACCRRRCLRRRIHNVNLQRDNEEIVRHSAIVVDRRRINDTLIRFLAPGERDFENLAL